MRVAVIGPASYLLIECAAVGRLTRIKAAALFGCLLFTSTSFAVDYYWSNGVGITGGSPGAVCNGAGQQTYANSPTQVFSRSDLEGPYDDTAFCQHYFTWNAASGADDLSTPYKGNRSTIRRGGSTCPVGTGPYDPATGMCTQQQQYKPGDECDDQTGSNSPENPMIWDDAANKCVKFSDSKGDAMCTWMANKKGPGSALKVVGSMDSGGMAVAPPTFIDNSINCQVATVSTSECTINIAGSISCNVIAKLTGKGNDQGEANAADALCPNGKCPIKEPLTETKEEGCTPIGNGSGGSNCTQEKETTQEGTQQCGLVNGAYKCFTKKPYSNGIKTDVSSTSQTLPDGSVKVTTIKNSTNTVCTDVKTCTSQTSTTTSHTITKPNGQTTTTTSCVGKCSPNGGGLETNPNSGGGNNNNGNGNGDGGGEEGEGTAATTDSCSTPPACDGDPFQCAILKQAHIDTCKLMAPLDEATKAEWNAKVSKAQADLVANQAVMDSQVNGLLGGFTAATSGSGAGAGKCLPDIPFSFMGHTTTMEFSKTCDSIGFIRLAILAMAYLFAARIVFKEV